ncbi:transposase [Streptomyces sp. LHD-70]|nr:transposase [Streptomyces sp. LHD-70]MDQ8706043.1 transposase [Streptomyces sp. LHD-70]
MGRGDQTDAQWERLRPFLPVSNRRCGRWRDHRQVIDGILYRVRTGVQWRDLPERFGRWEVPHPRWNRGRRRCGNAKAAPAGVDVRTERSPRRRTEWARLPSRYAAFAKRSADAPSRITTWGREWRCRARPGRRG